MMVSGMKSDFSVDLVLSRARLEKTSVHVHSGILPNSDSIEQVPSEIGIITPFSLSISV